MMDVWVKGFGYGVIILMLIALISWSLNLISVGVIDCRVYCASLNLSYGAYDPLMNRCICVREVACYLDFPMYCPNMDEV